MAAKKRCASAGAPNVDDKVDEEEHVDPLRFDWFCCGEWLDVEAGTGLPLLFVEEGRGAELEELGVKLFLIGWNKFLLIIMIIYFNGCVLVNI